MNVAIANNLNNCVLCTAQTLLKTTTIAAGPTKIASTATHFRAATVMALKSKAGTLNAGNVSLGPSATVNEQPIVLLPGDSYVLTAPVGAKWDFQDWYLVVANNNDGVVIIYS